MKNSHFKIYKTILKLLLIVEGNFLTEAMDVPNQAAQHISRRNGCFKDHCKKRSTEAELDLRTHSLSVKEG